ncbi:filamentous hemagglutinin family protein [Bradyrhizobium sp. WSM 1738]|uniref:filamentous haemagglutinin family protein n=1 Tax=Bradyrhizobium hereditatis TaxID=2821405 RepID=UPI001CE308CD|nr:filamentous haemagglutinin family protein [Bradyrhizobium hereditatis]MCA6116450.1 filamentous hemagglutinin family protein [Bradyrhizobium hereditatis]
MSNSRSSVHSARTGFFRHAALLASVSAAALLMADTVAHGRSLGGQGAAPSQAAISAAQSASQEASRAAQQASNSLKRATQAIQAMQAAQQAARNLALTAPSTVQNGLRPGGLVVMPGATPGATNGGAGLWQGANLPTESTNAGRTQVTVKQNEQKAILTWKEFNVGRETDLYFDQRAGGADAKNWIALNRVTNPGAAPSQILGSIKAEGQVYVINQNGIIFGGASQVNVNTLVASSLSLSNQQFLAGINTSIVVSRGLAGYMHLPQFGDYNPNLADSTKPANDPSQPAPFMPASAPGSVLVEAGAEVAAASGGKVMLFAPKVINSGLVSAQDGQVIMAAGEQIYLRTNVSTQSDVPAAVRGLDVAVTAPMPWLFNYDHLMGALKRVPLNSEQPYGDSVRDVILPWMYERAATVGYQIVNNGIVEANHGNITVMARDIVQNGLLSASTALNNRDGSIRLLAYSNGMMASSGSFDPALLYWQTGNVRLMPGSVTSAMPDLSDASEIELSALSTRYKPGRVELRGNLIDIQSQANVIVPAGTISVVASSAAQFSDEPVSGETPVRDGSRIYIGEEAYLSVAGLKDIAIAMDRNFVEAELRINELRDSVLYRDSWLRGQKIVVDRRESGAFTDGPMAGVSWGGAAGSWVGTPLADVSAWIGVGKTDLGELSTVGGSIFISSSGSIITRAGSILDVSGGSVRYADGLVKTTKLIGADGRIYDIADARPDQAYVAFAGGFTRSHDRWGITETWTSLLGKTGARYERGYTEGRDAGSIQFYAAEGIALEGSYWGGVVVGERQGATGEYSKAGSLTFGGKDDSDRQWLLDKLIITGNPVMLPKDFTATTALDASWYAPPPNASYLPERTTYLDSGVLAASELRNIELYVSDDFTLTRGTTLNLTPRSTFSVLANSVDSYSQNFHIDGTIRTAGGTVNLLHAESVKFGTTGAIDVSGHWVNELTNGMAALAPQVDGGTITLMNARFDVGAVLDVSGGGWMKNRNRKLQTQAGDGGTIQLNTIDMAEFAKADLRGYSAGSGGSLAFSTTGNLQIGGDVPAAADTFRLPETLFTERGFSSLQIGAGGSIIVPAGVAVSQPARSVDLTDAARFGSGTKLADMKLAEMGPLVVLPLSQRVDLKPTSLSLAGNNISIGAGAIVQTDIGGRITLAASTNVGGVIEISGRLQALAGTINVSAGAVAVTATGALVANGVPVIQTGAFGLRDGVVLGGGSVNVGGAVTLHAGSLIDVSGASGEIDLPVSGTFGSRATRSVALASNGGSISMSGQGLMEGTLRGHAGGSGARGGALTLSSGTLSASLILSDTAAAQPGLVVRPSLLQSAGFADLTLSSSSTIRLESVDLTVGSSISILGALVNGNGTSSRLSAPYISWRGVSSSDPTRAGKLTLAASLIDIDSASVRGFEQSVLEASDIRLTPLRLGLGASLDVDGTLVLKAGQVYPTSQTSATIRASDKIVVQQNGEAGLALSVGGSLTLEAPVIEQGGTLRAPFGQITVKASQKLTLGAGSVTSVSGDSLILPYGNLSNNENWTIVTTDGGQATVIASLPEKRITLDAPNVDLAAGSVVDIRGGGDLHASEHVPGPGGSHNVLSRPGLYAIVPALNDSIGVPDATLRSGDRIWLDGGSRIPAGWYTLLPARYALLPGAYAVQMVSGSQGVPIPRAVGLTDGSMIMAGYRGNAHDGSHDQLPSSWRVMSGDVVRKYSEYNEAFANTFFASDAFKLTQYRLTGQNIVTPRLPIDGGSVVFKATQDLILNGQLRSQAAAGGRGGLVDIAAQKIAILGTGQDAGALRADGYLVIDAVNLSGFGAGSLLVGGIRSGDTGGLRVDVTADNIIVRNSSDSALTGSEIILAASETIEVGAGSVIAARGDAPTGAGDLVMAPQVPQSINNNGTSNTSDDFVVPARDWGALIRVSNGDAVLVRRTNVDTTVGGQVTIGAGAVIDGGKALLIDATRSTAVTQATLSGAALSLASGRIGFGGGTGLVIDAAALAALANTQHLTLRSYSSIDFHRGVDLSGLNAVTFDSAALVGYGSNPITVLGNRLVLENTAAAFSEPAGAGHSTLSLRAAELAFGEGAKALRGFDTVMLTGTTRIVGEGNGRLDAGAATLTFSTPVLTGRGGASQSVTTTGAIAVAASGSSGPRDLDSLGARWSLTGRSVAFDGRIDALGGAVDLASTNGDVVLARGSLIDVGGFGKQFFDVAEYADAGRISLSAVGGSVLLNAGATLDLGSARDADGRPVGGGAGTLALASDGSQVVLDGTIKATAAAGQRGASFSLDIATLPNFAALSQRLNESGFSKSRAFRVRSGDVTVDGTTVVEEFSLSADQGIVTLAGTIDARARYGGTIALYGGQGLVMTNAAVLRAGATDTVDHLGSGRVTLGISGGALNIQGGVIDVAGGEGGKVTLRAPVIEQHGADTVNVSFTGTIAGAREIVLEGYKRFDLAQLAGNSNYVGVIINGSGQAELDLAATAAGKLNVLADYGAGTLVEFVRDFDISAAYGALGGLAGQANFHARAGMELNHTGDIVLKSSWNLAAGVVDQAGAIAAGVMAIDPILNKPYVVAGRQGDLLANHTTMIYRTGGSIFGEPGVLTLRAGGNLVLNGSISDGFFNFADPLDADYVAKANSYIADYNLLLNGGFNSGGGNSALTSWSAYTSTTALPTRYLGLSFGSTQTAFIPTVLQDIRASLLHVPYSAAANSAAAKGTMAGGAGDAVKYADLFPGVSQGGGQTVAPASWSYTLVAGATASGQAADPLQRMAGTSGSILLQEQPSFTYTANPAQQTRNSVVIDLNTGFSPSSAPNTSSGTTTPENWLTPITSYSGVNDNATAVVAVGRLDAFPARALLDQLFAEFIAEKSLVRNSSDPAKGYKIIQSSSTGYSFVMSVANFKLFYNQKIVPNLTAILATYTLPTPPVPPVQTTASAATMVRTGTGDINIAASGDIQLKGGASIYTAGRRDLTVFSDFTTAPATASYGVGGGHVHVAAGGNIDVTLPTNRSQMQHYTEWLKRQGTVNSSYLFGPVWQSGLPDRPPEQSSWWIDYTNFQRGVAALGGGNVDISAGGDLNNLTVAVPTNGRVRGGRTATEQKILELRNGGAMTVGAGGAVRAGYYYLGRGAGTIEAGEFAVGREVKVRGGAQVTTYPIAPILSLGDATLDVRTAGDLRLQTFLDPLMVGRGDEYEFSFMSGQTDRTALSLTSTGGDVSLVGQTTYLSKDADSTSSAALIALNNFAGNIYPSKLRIAALNGSVINESQYNTTTGLVPTLYTLPGSSPELRIVAADDVLVGSILMSRATPAMIPSPFEPVAGNTLVHVNLSGMHSVLTNPIGGPGFTPHALHLYNLSNPAHLPNENDYEPSRIYALNGSIIGTTYSSGVSIATAAITANEQTWFRAGTDIRNINYNLRNIHPTDVSLVEAGNDIVGGPIYGSIYAQGPGAVVVSAGRDVYAPELHIMTVGNRAYDTNNRPVNFSQIFGLPDESAAITVMAGLKGKQPSYDAFLAAYLDPSNVAAMPDYLKTTLADGAIVPIYFTDAYELRKSGQSHKIRSGLVSFVNDVTGETLTPQDAWARFQSLPMLTRERFVRQVYMQELREAGKDQNEAGTDGLPRNGGYNRGYTAIRTLFPGNDWKGDVAIGNALFRTMAGGNVEVLTPGGGLQVAALGKEAPSGYGLVTLGHGDINIFARNNVVVNRSRILTFGGGDEIIWSTVGDIDAGRGAKTARVPSAPEVQTDIDAVTRILEKADISGSGIGTIVGFTGVEEGDVHLIAPEGTVNAGDAGVRVSGNLNIAALFVLNANNFQVSGEVKGLPVKESSAPPLKLEGDASQKAATDAVKDVTQSRTSERPSVIIVEVLGFGGGDGDTPANPDESRERSAPSEQRSQDPNSAYQVLGAGEMTADEARQVIAERRRASGQR